MSSLPNPYVPEYTRAMSEADKARKRKSPPWSREAWQAAARAPVVQPERRFPIIITAGPFSTPQKLQEVAGLPSLPDVQTATRASFSDDDDEEEGGSEERERMQYCRLGPAGAGQGIL